MQRFHQKHLENKSAVDNILIIQDIIRSKSSGEVDTNVGCEVPECIAAIGRIVSYETDSPQLASDLRWN